MILEIGILVAIGAHLFFTIRALTKIETQLILIASDTEEKIRLSDALEKMAGFAKKMKSDIV